MMMLCVITMYVLVVLLMILDKTKSSNSSVEGTPCQQKMNCTGCVKELDNSDHSTGLYWCKGGFVLTEYVIRTCNGTCENECFSVSNHTSRHKSDNFQDVEINVTAHNITLTCTSGPTSLVHYYIFCNFNDKNARAVGVIPQCLSADPTEAHTTDRTTEVPSKPKDVLLIILGTIAGCITICSMLLIFYCVRNCRRKIWRGRHNIEVSFSKPLQLDITEVNTHISPESNYNHVGFANENGAISNRPKSQLNNTEILDNQTEANDVYNIGEESDHGVDDMAPDNYSTVRIGQTFNGNQTQFVDDALDTSADYDTIDSARKPKATCRQYIGTADTTDADYNYLHTREDPIETQLIDDTYSHLKEILQESQKTNDTYSHFKKIHGINGNDPEHARVIKRVEEPTSWASLNNPTSQLNHTEILDKQVNDEYNITEESDHGVDNMPPDNYSTARIGQTSDGKETQFVVEALDTSADYDTIDSARNPKTITTCGLLVGMAGTTDADYDHLHASRREVQTETQQIDDTYSHLKEIQETTDDPEYAHVIKRVEEPANTDEQIEVHI